MAGAEIETRFVTGPSACPWTRLVFSCSSRSIALSWVATILSKIFFQFFSPNSGILSSVKLRRHICEHQRQTQRGLFVEPHPHHRLAEADLNDVLLVIDGNRDAQFARDAQVAFVV
jgi:hypothetical protein